MEITYNLAIFFIGLLITFGPIALIVFIIKPASLSGITKRHHTRKSIAKRGLLGGIAALVVLATLGAVFEPANVKAERLAKQKANLVQKSTVEKNEEKKFEPVKKTAITKSIIDYRIVESEDNTLARGETRVDTEGVVGERTKTYEVTYTNGVETDRKLLKDEITKEATDRLVRTGTYVAPVAPSQLKSTYAPSSSAQQATPSSSNTYYANCTAARSAGVAPIYSGQAGYRSALDRDKDGIACE